MEFKKPGDGRDQENNNFKIYLKINENHKIQS